MKCKQEQVEEMSQVLLQDTCEGWSDNRGCVCCRSAQHNCVSCKQEAIEEAANSSKKLYAARYRKADEIIDEIVKRIRESFQNRNEIFSDERPEFSEDYVSLTIELVAEELKNEISRKEIDS